MNAVSGKQEWKPSKEEVFEFLQTLETGVLSTLGKSGQPQSATVAFSQTRDLKFLVGTSKTSRKAQNIQRDGRVAFVATDPVRRYTVQLDGTAHILTNEEFELYADTHFEKLPGSQRWRNAESECHILIAPHWLRFSDCSVYPWATTEVISGS